MYKTIPVLPEDISGPIMVKDRRGKVEKWVVRSRMGKDQVLSDNGMPQSHSPRQDLKDRALDDKLAWVAWHLERSKIAEYVDLMSKPARLVYLNLLGGLARGVGLAVGFTILGALVIYILTRSFLLNLPVVGQFLGELVYIVQQYLRSRP